MNTRVRELRWFCCDLWFAGFVLLFGFGSLLAQDFSIESPEISLIEGTADGGEYILSGTVSLLDPDSISGGEFELAGSVSATTPLLALHIALLPGGQVQIAWPSPSTGYLLQVNTNNVSSVNWSNVTATISDDGTTKTFTVSPPAGNRFYRLFKP